MDDLADGVGTGSLVVLEACRKALSRMKVRTPRRRAMYPSGLVRCQWGTLCIGAGTKALNGPDPGVEWSVT